MINHKVVAIILVLLFAFAVFVVVGGEDTKRSIKDFTSNYAGGLDRTVTLYSNDGEELRQWTGKFDVTASENEVAFDIDGHRVIIHGGIVVNEEN